MRWYYLANFHFREQKLIESMKIFANLWLLTEHFEIRFNKRLLKYFFLVKFSWKLPQNHRFLISIPKNHRKNYRTIQTDAKLMDNPFSDQEKSKVSFFTSFSWFFFHKKNFHFYYLLSFFAFKIIIIFMFRKIKCFFH